MVERMYLPEDLEETPPGPELGTVLAGVDRCRLNGYDVVRLMQARARQVAHEQAGLLADMAEVTRCAPGGPDAAVARVATEGSEQGEFAGCEISAALQLTRARANCQLGLAVALADLPTVHEALSAGLIDIYRAQVIADAVLCLPTDLAAAIAGAALKIAPGMTAGKLRAALAALVIKTDPDAARKRYQQGVAGRKLVRGQSSEHTGYLSGVNLPADRAARAFARVDAIAAQLKHRGDTRRLDQLRADVYLDLLDGITLPVPAAAQRGSVDLLVRPETLAGTSHDPGLVPGFGPVLAEIARQIAWSQPRWRYSLTDTCGRLTHHGVLRARPTTVEYAFVAARDRHCRFPTCRTPASHAEHDHTTQRQHGGGHTRDNLAMACRYHHRAKDTGGHQLRQLGHGRLEWTTPLGHSYLTDPDPPPF